MSIPISRLSGYYLIYSGENRADIGDGAVAGGQLRGEIY